MTTERPIHAEDLSVNQRFAPDGTYTVTRCEIIEFAQQWDPQAIHVDEEAAAAGYYGGLIASGLHSLALLQRLSVEHVLSGWANVAGSALRDARFHLPLRPDTDVRAEIVITDIRHTRADRSNVVRRSSLITSGGDVLVTTTIENWIRRRHR